MSPIRLRWIVLACCLVPWLVLLGATRQDDPSHWTAPQWITWRDTEIRKILLPEFDANGERVLLRLRVVTESAAAYSFVAPMLNDPMFLADAGRAKALGNFVKFVSTVGRINAQSEPGVFTNLLAMSLTDKDYFHAASKWVSFPDLLKSQLFLNCLSKPSSYPAAVEMIERQNHNLPLDDRWIVQPFRAQFVKSVDETTYGRLLVLVPNLKLADGRVLDRWIMFALATPETPENIVVRSVSVIAVLHDPMKPGVNQGFLCDFMRDRDPSTGEIRINSNHLVKNSASKNCYDCHKTAVLPIHPKNLYSFSSAGKLEAQPEVQNSTLNQLNAMIFQYGKTNYSFLDAENFGPTIGTVGPNRSDEFISEATNDAPIPFESIARVKAAMNCAKCHSDFARINYPLAVRSDQEARSFESKKALVRTTIELGIMPPKNDLNDKERHALWRCLSKEYLDLNTQKGTFIDWLKGQG